MPARKEFLFYLIDTPTGKAYYVDNSGIIQLVNIGTAGFDVSLQDAPMDWLETELGFIRNEEYHGFNRSFATPQGFVKDAYYMINNLFLKGVGTEVPLTLAIYKYNSNPLPGEPTYKFYHKVQLDLPEITTKVGETVTCPLMEGGVSQLLKSYDNTELKIPCDGSIPENVKSNLDGMFVPDKLLYQISPVENIKLIANILPANYIENESDNYGIVTGSPSLQTLDSYNDLINNSNCHFYSSEAIKIKVEGFITVDKVTDPTNFKLFYSTNKILGDLVDIIDFTWVSSLSTFKFRADISLDAYEKLFLMFNLIQENGSIKSGQFTISLVSKYKATRAWGIGLYDLFKLIVKSICQLASKNGINYNYGADSELLLQYNDIIVSSADAIRASGDSSYQKFFHPQDINGYISYGPVIKTNLSDFFVTVSSFLCAALGSQQLAAQVESLFIEKLQSVFNSDVINMELGEVADFEWSHSKNYGFSDLEIGYPSESFDQKAGKYETNTTAKWKAPINSFKKPLSKLSKYSTSPYLIERLRSNIGQATSTTRNDNDNKVCMVSCNKDSFVYDFYKQYFNSLIPDPDDENNTNIKLFENRNLQPVSLPISDGEYFQPRLDQGVFIFTKAGYSATESCNLTIEGTLESVNHVVDTPLDTVTIKLWRNGAVIYTETITYSGPGTVINIDHDFSQLFNAGDCVYVTASTSATGVAQLTSSILTIGSYVSMAADSFIPVESGTAIKLLSMGTVIPTSNPWNDTTSVVTYGYQYLVYNSLAVNNEFNLSFNLKGYVEGAVDFVNAFVYINGVQQGSFIQIPTTVARAAFDETITLPVINFNLGDIVFIAVTVPENVTFEITNSYINAASTQVKAYSLRREVYDSISGIPNLATDADGNLRTDIAGAPYNIEPFTPLRMYEQWEAYFESCFLDEVTGDMSFQSLSKNEYLSTSKDGVTKTENANRQIINGNRLFYPIQVAFKTDVPLNFNEIMMSARNAHIHLTYYGNDVYFFPEDVRQKPGLNESQIWKGLLSPKTDLSVLANITNDGIKLLNMAGNSIYCPTLSSIQFVPEGRILPAKYHTKSRNEYWFIEQVSDWINKKNYWSPVQIGDPIPLQFITNGLDPVYYSVYNCCGKIVTPLTELDTISSGAVNEPYVLWGKSIDTSSWDPGTYYLKITAGVGENAAVLISEGLDVRVDWPGTLAFEFSSSFNTQTMIFSEGHVGFIRVKGSFNNRFQNKYKGAFYVDQPQDIEILNAIPYEVTSLWIGEDDGVPDYVMKKISRALLLNECKIEGEGFSLNEGAEWEEVFIDGNPKKYHKIEIRPSKNDFGITVNAEGIDADTSIIASLDVEAVGPNANNYSGTTDTNIIDVIINN